MLIHTQCYFIAVMVAKGRPSFISLVGSPEVVNVSMAIKAFSNIKESNMASAHVRLFFGLRAGSLFWGIGQESGEEK